MLYDSPQIDRIRTRLAIPTTDQQFEPTRLMDHSICVSVRLFVVSIGTFKRVRTAADFSYSHRPICKHVYLFYLSNLEYRTYCAGRSDDSNAPNSKERSRY